jgi:two-component SAPR family response regulator
VAPDVGVPGRLAATVGIGQEVALLALGRFTVLHAGQPVPLAAWQSRKARDLLKVLVARKGRPLAREAAAETLWPDEESEAVSNRLSVALSTIRKVLDPNRKHAPDHFLVSDARTIALRIDNVNVDLIEFLRSADRAIELMTKGDRDAAEPLLRRSRQLYAGDFLEEDLYEDWAVDAREEARIRLLMILRMLARLAAEREPYDEDAWLSLVASQLRLRRHGEARRHYATYARRMGELDVVPVALAEAASWRP